MNKTFRLILKYVFIGLIGLGIISFLNPELTIRRDILFRLHPITSVTAKVSDMDRHDVKYGHLYDVTGYTDRATGDEMSVFYLKKHGPFWIVASTGTGP